jgi:hypothetical protein
MKISKSKINEWYDGWQWISNDSERIWNNLIGSDLVGSQCYSYTAEFYSYPDERCDDTPGNWQYCRMTRTYGIANTCVQVHSNGLSDAFIPFVSQRGEGSNSWRVRNANSATSSEIVKIEAFGVNHLEELDAGNGVMRDAFRDVFSGNRGSIFRIDNR